MTTLKRLRNINARIKKMIKYDGLDEAICGQACIWRDQTRVDVLVYDGMKIIDIFVDRDGMTPEEAEEFIEFNIEGGYIGEETPVVMWPVQEDYE
jgi:hypothetical protein